MAEPLPFLATQADVDAWMRAYERDLGRRIAAGAVTIPIREEVLVG